MQNLIAKQDEMIRHLQDRNVALDLQLQSVSDSRAESEQKIQQMQALVERLRVGEQESEKQKGQLDVARDHNKKLVELL